MHRHLKGGCSQVGSVFSQATSDGIRGNGLKLYQGKFVLDIRKKFFTRKSSVNHWNKLPRLFGRLKKRWMNQYVYACSSKEEKKKEEKPPTSLVMTVSLGFADVMPQ
ncbi:hypothetical protein BTVI_16214 [Pitangus sulphuratus]|nr:hypothetical protein BTVI_16214 [Pitangus sulphuratus]